MLEYAGDKDKNNVPDPSEIGIVKLKGDGDFRSEESIEPLKQADIVVTNLPFSLFREYGNQLLDYDKKFHIVGTQNAITYKDIFPRINSNRIWLAYNNGDMAFKVELTRFRVHLTVVAGGIHDGRQDGPIYAGVQAADGYKRINAKAKAKAFNYAQRHFEIAIEFLTEQLQLDPSLALWVDRNISDSAKDATALCGSAMPRCVTSRSADKASGGSQSALQKKMT